ncbi:hypothetical protein EDC04DRAFT_2895683 [Pisolithus marmoratus]|nr:hypothetical protein EDC04DRAFT_2895683 [Pisolithus marmoratus]
MIFVSSIYDVVISHLITDTVFLIMQYSSPSMLTGKGSGDVRGRFALSSPPESGSLERLLEELLEVPAKLLINARNWSDRLASRIASISSSAASRRWRRQYLRQTHQSPSAGTGAMDAARNKPYRVLK